MAKKISAIAAATTTILDLGVFETVYGATPDEIKAQQKGLVKNKLKRNIRSAYDSASGKRLDAIVKMDELVKNFEGFDVNVILSKQNEIENIDKTLEKIKALYLKMFNEEMRTVEE